MGFGAEYHDKKERSMKELFDKIHPDDLIHYGMIPEFIGRLPITVCLEELKVDDLRRIITEPKNAIIKQYRASMAYDGVELEFTEEAVNAIAEMAIKQKTGARGLRAIVERQMTDIMYEIPSMTGFRRVIVTKDSIEKSLRPDIIELAKSA